MLFYPLNGELLNEGTHVRANLTTSRHSERKEGVGSAANLENLENIKDAGGEARGA